jgi:hypothetical protein
MSSAWSSAARVMRVDDDVVEALAQDFEHLEDVLGLDVVGRVGLARRGEQGELGRVRDEEALQQRVVHALAVLDHVGDGEFRLDAEEEAEVARVHVQVDEHRRRFERRGDVRGDEGRAAAALAGEDGDDAPALLRRLGLFGAELGDPRVDGRELVGDDGQAQELARAGAHRAQDGVGRGVARGADDGRARALGGEARDEAQLGLGRGAERDDRRVRREADNLFKNLLGVVAADEEARPLLRGQRAAQLFEAFEPRAQDREG